MPDALPAATLPVSRLGDWLRICWIAYAKAGHIGRISV